MFYKKNFSFRSLLQLEKCTFEHNFELVFESNWNYFSKSYFFHLVFDFIKI